METEIKKLSTYTTLIYSDVYECLCIKKMLKGSNAIFQTLKALEHPNIPEIFEIHDTYVLLRYIEGKNLTEYLAQNSVMLALDTFILTLALELCAILEPLHASAIIHKDIKPENIIIDTDQKVYVIDFDVSRFIGKQDRQQDTELFGTRGFASPEHFGFHPTDQRSDIYSLGKVLELYTSSPLMLPIIKKCTKLDAADRYQTIGAVEHDLLQLLERLDDGILVDSYLENEALDKIFDALKEDESREQSSFWSGNPNLEVAEQHGSERMLHGAQVQERLQEEYYQKTTSKILRYISDGRKQIRAQNKENGTKKSKSMLRFFYFPNIIHLVVLALAILLAIATMYVEIEVVAKYPILFRIAVIFAVFAGMLIVDGIIFIIITCVESSMKRKVQMQYFRTLVYIVLGIIGCVVGFVLMAALDVML